MDDVDVEVVGSRVIIEFKRTGLALETLSERTSEVLPLLLALILADSEWCKLKGDDLAKRENACRAIDMMCQGAIQSATERARVLMAIADGSASIEEHGFPEFKDGQSLDV